MDRGGGGDAKESDTLLLSKTPPARFTLNTFLYFIVLYCNFLIAQHDLTCALGADDDSDICESFGVWGEKSMYGRTYMGITRATFLITADGTVAKAWPKVKVPGHAEEVLEAVKAL